MRGYVVGRVERTERKTPNDGKKPYVQLTVKEQDGQYTRWVQVKVYGQRGDEALELAKGTLVVVEGSVSAFVTSKDGKNYANLSVLGGVQVIDEGEDVQPTRAAVPQAAPQRPSPKPAAQDPKPPLKMDSEVEDDVPF